MGINLSIRIAWLWIILAGALVVRLAGLTYGFPLDVQGDEFVHVVTSFSLLEEMTLRALSPLSYVPSLLAVLMTPFAAAWGGLLMLTGAVDGIAGFKEYAILNAVYFMGISRVISAFSGVLFVYILFLIVRRLTNEKFALIATLMTAADFWLTHQSGRGFFWMFATALVAGAFYMLIHLAETGTIKYWRESVAAIALGFWAGYFPIILVPFLALAHWHSPNRKTSHLVYGGIALAALVALVGWLNPLSFLKQFGRALRSALDVVGINVFPEFAVSADKATEPLANLSLFLKLLVLDNPFIFVLGVAGMVALVLRFGYRSFVPQLVVGFFTLYLIAATFIWSHPDNRYVLPLFLPLYISAAYGMYVMWEYVREKRLEFRYAAIFCIVIAVFYSAYPTLIYAIRIQKADTRLEARQWIIDNVPSEAVILTDAQYLELPRSRAAITYLKKYLPEATRKRDEVVLNLPEYRVPQPAYFVVNTEYAQKLADARALPPPAYVVVGFYDLANKPTIPPDQYTLVQSWYPGGSLRSIPEILMNPVNPFRDVRSVTRFGPNIEIFRKVE